MPTPGKCFVAVTLLISSPFLVSSFSPSQYTSTFAKRRSSSSLLEGSLVDDSKNNRSWLDKVTNQKQMIPIGSSGLLDDEQTLDVLPTSQPSLLTIALAKNNHTALDMAITSIIGLTFTIGVIYMLAMFGDTPADLSVPEVGKAAVDEELSKLAHSVIVAAMPEDANDLIAITLGEGIGAVIGSLATAVVTTLVTIFLRIRMDAMNAVNDKQSIVHFSSSEDILSEAVADTEYFWTRAGALPLLNALGVRSSLARLTSVALATVPYEVVKWQSKKEKQRQAEKTLMDELLYEQQQSEQAPFAERPKRPRSVDPLKLQAIERRPVIDIPEIFSDVIKWLEYDVLKTDFRGQLVVDGHVLGSGAESAVFGVVIALSSQLYLDIIYCYTDFGPDHTTKETRARSPADWTYLYINRCLGTATLFGVYESVSYPVSIALQGLLAGAVDGCVGSLDFNACMETFVADNPPEASPEAQLRSFAIAVVSLIDRVQIEGLSDSPEVIRALVVQLYNVASQYIPWLQP
jgi:hypothetical protein